MSLASGDERFLRDVVAQLRPDNTRWPGLWTRLDALLRERDELAGRLADTERERDEALRDREQAWLALGRFVTGDHGVDVTETVQALRAVLADGVGS